MPSKRYFEFSEGTSNKFWEVWRDGASVFTRYGKIGANGQVTVKKLGSDADAKALHDKLVGEKTKKGYVEGGGKGGGKAPAKAGGKAKPAAKNGKAAAAEDTGKPEIIVIPEGGCRLEVVEGKSSKFWTIVRNEKQVTVTFGKIGTEGQVQKKKYKDEWEARSDVKKQIEDKKKKGYQYVLAGPRVVPPAAHINEQLEAAILKDPSSDDGYMVYADWLMEQADPRGELASIQARLAKSPKDKKLKNAEAKLLWDQRAYFFGPLAIYLDKKSDDYGHAAATATWRQGWMDTLELSAISAWGDASRPMVPDCGELIRLLPKVASARLIREFVIGCPKVEDEFSFHKSIEELVKVMPHLPNLRRIVLGNFDYEDSELSWSHLGQLKKFWPVAGKLEYLKIHAGNMDLGTINAPELRHLEIESGGFDKKNLASILNANMPKLEHLNIWFGQDNYGCDVEPKHVAPLLDCGKKFPKLKHLGIANTTFGNELAPMVVNAKILKQLTSLNLSMSHLTVEGMQVYVQHADALKHLELDFSRCLLNSEGKKLAKTLGKSVKIDDQDDPNDHQPEGDDEDDEDNDRTNVKAWWRYSAVGE